MMYTRITRWLRDIPSDAHKLTLSKILPDGSYVWTGYPGNDHDGEQFVWELLMWAVDERTVLLVDTLLGEYYID